MVQYDTITHILMTCKKYDNFEYHIYLYSHYSTCTHPPYNIPYTLATYIFERCSLHNTQSYKTITMTFTSDSRDYKIHVIILLMISQIK